MEFFKTVLGFIVLDFMIFGLVYLFVQGLSDTQLTKKKIITSFVISTSITIAILIWNHYDNQKSEELKTKSLSVSEKGS